MIDIDPNTLLIDSDNFSIEFSFSIDETATSAISPVDIKGELIFDNNGVLLLSTEVCNLFLQLLFCYVNHLLHDNYVLQTGETNVSFAGDSCIGGYVLSSIGGNSNRKACQCDDTERNILLCEEDQDSIIIEVGLKHFWKYINSHNYYS